MKSNIKKGVLSLGTIAAVAAPIAAVISCGSTQNTINWKDSDTFGGVKGSDFLTEIKHLGKTKENAITVGREQMMQLQYESESIRSLSAQVEDFKYANWQTEMDNKKLENDKADVKTDKDNYLKTITTDGSTDEAKIDPDKKNQDTLDGFETKDKAIDDATKDNNDKITAVTKKITALTDVLSKLDLTQEFLQDKDSAVSNFYKDTYSATEYPEVYKSLSVIRTEKTDIVNDAYRTFYPQFTKREDGDREWPAELAKNYGGAATFSQAIDYLVTQEVSAKAFNSYKFEISKSFTVQQKLWAQYIDKNSYKFLIADGADVAGSQHDPKLDEDIKSIIGTSTDADAIKTNIENNILSINKGDVIDTNKHVKPLVLSSTEIFLGSKSPDHRMQKDAIAKLGNVVKYQHLLIKATQGKTPSEAWTITADDLKKLMEFDQYKDGTVKITQGAEFLTNDKLFGDGDVTQGDDRNKFTDFVLGAISGNSAGTIKTQGSLGIKTEIEYLKAMVPGFSLGALAITEGTSKVIDATSNAADIKAGTKLPTLDLADLIKNLKIELEKEVKKTYPSANISKAPDASNLDEVNNEIDATITALGDDKVKSIFGKVFEEFFKDKKDLVYKLTGSNENYLVISQFGIHIIKRTSYADASKITEALNTDMADMAKDSSLGSSTSLVDELNAQFTDTKIMEILLGSTPVDSKDGYVGALNKKLEEYNKDKTEDIDKVTTQDIKDVIESVNKLKDKTDVDSAIGDKLENWLVTQLDANLRDIGDLKLSQIYGWVTKGVQ